MFLHTCAIIRSFFLFFLEGKVVDSIEATWTRSDEFVTSTINFRKWPAARSGIILRSPSLVLTRKRFR